MRELFEMCKNWVLGLGELYGVDPFVFASIYVGAIPFFLVSMAWFRRNCRSGKSVLIPSLAAAFFFVAAYLYLLVEGENVPWWTYVIPGGLLAGSSFSLNRKLRSPFARRAKPVSNQSRVKNAR